MEVFSVVGSGPHAEQTERMRLGLDEMVASHQPDAVLLYGDTNSMLAGSKRETILVHVEASPGIEPTIHAASRRLTVPDDRVRRGSMDRLSSVHTAWNVQPRPTGDFDSEVSLPAGLRPGAKGLVRNGHRVLLVRERRADGSRFWSLPGGGVRPGESRRAALRREFFEEIGCRPVLGAELGACVYDHRTCPETTVYAVFEAAIAAEPDPNWRESIVDHEWFHPLDLPPNTLDPIERFLNEAYRTDTHH